MDSRDLRAYLPGQLKQTRRIGISARLRNDSGKVISGSMFSSALYAFSSVFIFMNRHSLQKQLSVGPGMNVLCGNLLAQPVQQATLCPLTDPFETDHLYPLSRDR